MIQKFVEGNLFKATLSGIILVVLGILALGIFLVIAAKVGRFIFGSVT